MKNINFSNFANKLCLLTLVTMTGASLADDSRLMIDARACVGISSHLERLTCYDQLVGLVVESQDASSEQSANREQKISMPTPAAASEAKPATVVAPAPTAAIIEQQAVSGSAVQPVKPAPVLSNAEEQQFGMQTKNQDEKVVELHSKITALNEKLPGRYQITLENGQVWWQKVSARYQLEVGDDVRIYPSGWGSSYRLTVVDRNGFVQVERVK